MAGDAGEMARDIVAVVGVLLAIIAIVSVISIRRVEEKTYARIEELEGKAHDEPLKNKPAWDLARVTLEAYFSRNLTQVTAIFWLCVFVMFVGFAIIVWGIAIAIQDPAKGVTAGITGLAGVVTELIGATFLFVYRSTMQQATAYTKTLERINSVGMAMQILDTMPNEAQPDSLKNSTKAAVVKMLMQRSYDTDAVEQLTMAAASSPNTGGKSQ
jgi:nitrate reductase gamma subunit